MGTYLGKVQIGNNVSNIMSLGSTLYGTCTTLSHVANKEVTLADFDRTQNGISIRVKFVNGNEADTNVTLQVGTAERYGVQGDCTCGPGEVIEFTWEQGLVTSYWYVTSGGLSQKIKDYVAAASADVLSAAKGMVYKGTLGIAANFSQLPSSGYSAGWTYKVITAGQYNLGQQCEVGDIIMSITEAGTNQNTFNASHWTIIQGKLLNYVAGPNSSVNNRVAVFDGDSGKLIKDSGHIIETDVPSNAVFTDTNTSYRYTLNNANVTAYTNNEVSDNDGTVLVTIDNGILKLAKGIKFTSSTATISLNETSAAGPSLL